MQKYFSHEVTISGLTGKENIYNFSANKDNLLYLKELFGVEEVINLVAKVSIRINKKTNILIVKGSVSSELVLKSVISLENFKEKYDVPFEVKYDLSAKPEDFDGIEFDLEEEVMDIVVGDKIDLADLAIEQIALSIDEYPRKKGEKFEYKQEFDPEEKKNPFAILKKLKK